jgi:hypothetical protein
MKIDIKKLQQAIKTATTKLTTLKQSHKERQRNLSKMWQLYNQIDLNKQSERILVGQQLNNALRELSILDACESYRDYATILYSIRASLRGKLHRTKVKYYESPNLPPKIITLTKKDQDALIEHHINDFLAE